MNNLDKPNVKLGEFYYDPKTHLLTIKEKEVVRRLTPTEARILEYLYNNNNKSISRDELLNVAAENRVVDGSIITQYIKSIRKALDDSASNPKYIRTLQKEGYQFIAPVKKDTGKKKLPTFYWLLPIAILFFSILYFALPYLSEEKNVRVSTPLTSLKGQELFGDASPNGEYIVFSHKEPNQPYWRLVLKKRSEEKYYQLTESNVNDWQVKFSPSGNQLMYLHYSNEVNQIRIAQINWTEKKLENIKVQVTLPPKLHTVYLDWKDENNIYYSSQEKYSFPVQIFSHNIETKSRQVITKPPNNGAGDLALAYSRDSKKLAFLRNIAFSKANVIIYDVETGVESIAASLPVEPYSIDWINKGTGLIVRTSEHQIDLISLNGAKPVNIANSKQSIYSPFVIDDNSIGYTEGNFYIIDIEQGSLTGKGAQQPVISSAYNDYQPAYAQITESMAFISTRTGQKQIWLKFSNGGLKQITHFTTSKDIQDIAINKQGNFIAYTVNAELHIIEVETGKSVFILDGDNESHHNPVFSYDGNELIYTIKNNDKWQLEKRKLNNMNLSTVITYGNIAIPSKTFLYFLKPDEPNLYKLDHNGISTDTGILLGDIYYIDQVEIIDNFIYYTQKIDGVIKLLAYDLTLKNKEVVSTASAFRFSLNHKEHIYYSAINNVNDTNIKTIPVK